MHLLLSGLGAAATPRSLAAREPSLGSESSWRLSCWHPGEVAGPIIVIPLIRNCLAQGSTSELKFSFASWRWSASCFLLLPPRCVWAFHIRLPVLWATVSCLCGGTRAIERGRESDSKRVRDWDRMRVEKCREWREWETWQIQRVENKASSWESKQIGFYLGALCWISAWMCFALAGSCEEGLCALFACAQT